MVEQLTVSGYFTYITCAYGLPVYGKSQQYTDSQKVSILARSLVLVLTLETAVCSKWPLYAILTLA